MMPDEGMDQRVQDSSAGSKIAVSVQRCMKSFDESLSQASAIHAQVLSRIEDQLARFSTWAMAMGALAPGRASMDHRLRFASDVQTAVDGLLESLNYRIMACFGILKGMQCRTSDDSVSIYSEQLDNSLMRVGAEITRLNKISNTIRKASKTKQNQNAADFQLKDEAGHDVEPSLFKIFEHYIGDRFPNISINIRHRIARSMILRRKRVLYRRYRQEASTIRPQPTTREHSSGTTSDQQTKEPHAGNVGSCDAPRDAARHTSAPKSTFSRAKSATTLDPQRFKMAHLAPSVISESKTVALRNHEPLTFPPAPGFAAKRKFEQLKSQREAKHSEKSEGNEETRSQMPNTQRPGETDLNAVGDITCPYCLETLPAELAFSEREWEKHVKNDLEPYICLFPDCEQPDVLFNHGEEWRNHMNQHRRFWRCSSHDESRSFATHGEYVRHMREDHNTTLNDSQLRALANRSIRKTSKLFEVCPLCGSNESPVEDHLESHITGHLSSLALKSLPSYAEETPEDMVNDKNSADASGNHSRSTIREFFQHEDEYMAEDPPFVQLASGDVVDGFPDDAYSNFDQKNATNSVQFFPRTVIVQELPQDTQTGQLLDPQTSAKLQIQSPFESGPIPFAASYPNPDYGKTNDERIQVEIYVSEDEKDLDFKPQSTRKRTHNPTAKVLSASTPERKRSRIGAAGLEQPTKLNPPVLSRGTEVLCTECKTSFSDESTYQRHMKQHHTRPFKCVFDFAGCPSTFASKNEWKRHTSSQHLYLNYWLCCQDGCSKTTNPPHSRRSAAPSPYQSGAPIAPALPNGAIFNRKDLYTQHVRRMHIPPNVRKVQKQKKPTPEWDDHLKALQAEAEQTRCDLPRYMRCPADGCGHEFNGPEAWDERMEHVARHLDRAAEGKESVVRFGGNNDPTLIQWASSPKVSIIRMSQESGNWELINPLRGTLGQAEGISQRSTPTSTQLQSGNTLKDIVVAVCSDEDMEGEEEE